MGDYDQIKQAFQDMIAPEIRTLQVEIRRLDEKVDALGKRLDEKIDSLEKRMDTRINSLEQRLDTRIDSLERELKVAIDIRERLAALEAKLGT